MLIHMLYPIRGCVPSVGTVRYCGGAERTRFSSFTVGEIKMYRTLRRDFTGLHDANRLSFLVLLDVDESPVNPCSIQGETEEVR